MSLSLTEPQDVARLAARDVCIDDRVSVGQMPRLVEALPQDGNEGLTVDCTLRFALDGAGGVAIDARLSTRWMLTCQRCLDAVGEDVHIEVTWRSGELPDGDFELDAGPVRLVEWIEDELLLHLPAVPVHAQLEECAEWARRHLQPTEAAVPTKTPFAGLKDLLKGRE